MPNSVRARRRAMRDLMFDINILSFVNWYYPCATVLETDIEKTLQQKYVAKYSTLNH